MANGWIEVDKKNADGPKVMKKVIFFHKLKLVIHIFEILNNLG